MPTTISKTTKIKKSFSISPASDLFIRRMRKDRRAKSESETLDGLLRELMVLHQQRAIEAAYSDYYDSLSDEDMSEQHSWGKFAEKQNVDAVR